MTTTLTRFILCVILFSYSLYAKEIDVTFEVFHAPNKYMDIARQKAMHLNKDGLKCYILQGKKELSVRCNDSTTIDFMQRTIRKLQKEDIKFVIINNNIKQNSTKYQTLHEFYLGYAALNRKEYAKARDIFAYNYNKEKTYEHAYAYSLALLKLGKYKKAMSILKPYTGIPKAKKLYSDIASTYKYKKRKKFYLGYTEFDKKNYTKARKIFKYYYNKEKTYEHAYAYSLVLLKLGEYEKAMSILKPYTDRAKEKKLYGDIALTYMYKTLRKKKYTKAHQIVDKYQNKSQRLHTIINKQEVDDALKSKDYSRAALLAKKYHFNKISFDIEYMKALTLIHQKEYTKSNEVLAPYVPTQSKAKKLYIDNIISLASLSYAKKNYKEALDRLEPYKDDSVKVQTLYNDILYNSYLNNGWEFVDKSPKSALTAFKASCKIKQEYSCYSGMMYSYYNLETYDKSLYLAEKLYQVQPSDELSTMAMRSSLKMKDYKQAKVWFDRTKNKKGLTSPYLLETFLTIDDFTKAKKYEKAQNIVDYLKGLYPQNIDILKREMQLYVLKKEYGKAENVAHKILLLDKDSIAAKYTLALYKFQQQDYASCTQQLKSLNLKEEYQKNLYYRCSAYNDVTNRDMNRSEITIQKVVNNDAMKEAYYYDIGDMYRSIGDARAITAYKKARSYGPQNINTEFLYLYALKDFKKYKDLDKEILRAYKKYPNNSEVIDKFRHNYEKERLYNYYVNKKYKACAEYADMIEMNQNDRDIYKMDGWCAYALGEYPQAKEKFAESNLRFGETNEDTYAYALASYQNGQEHKAKEALDRIKVIKNEKEAFLIAQLYINLQEQESAKNILLKLKESDQREKMLHTLNKSYTQRVYENSASVGMYHKVQTGLEGKSKFEKYVIPIDYDYYNQKHDYHIYFDGDMMYLYNGYLEGKENSIKGFGLGTTTQNQPLASDIGFMPKLGIDYKYIRAEIGTTPIGAKITPELTWLLAGYIPYKNWSIALKIEQEEVEETMLSFVGERAIDGTQEVNWGRILKRGVEGSINYSGTIDFTLSLTYNPQIFGLNVENNSEKKATALAVYHPEVKSIAYVNVGAILAFDSYKENSNFFTYGHGGYFSPQQFFLGSLYTKLGDILNQDWYYQAKFGLGFEGFIVDDSYKFPLHDGIVNSGEIQKGYRDGGVVYKAAAQLGYKINDNFDLISGISFERINGYQTQQASLAFVYRFDKMSKPTLNSFSLNHRINQILQ